MSDTTSKDDLRDFMGAVMFGPKYFDYCLTPPTNPPSKYPYPKAIADLDRVMARVRQYGVQERIDELGQLLHDGVCEYLIGWARVCEGQEDCPAIRKRIAELHALKDKEKQ